MIQVLIAGNLCVTHCRNEVEAQREAVAKLVQYYTRHVPGGKRWLSHLPEGKLTWEYVETHPEVMQYVEFQEMIGVWIETDGGEYYPQQDYGMDDEESRILFKTEDGRLHYGSFDSTDCTYQESENDNTFAANEVVAWLVIPECPF